MHYFAHSLRCPHRTDIITRAVILAAPTVVVVVGARHETGLAQCVLGELGQSVGALFFVGLECGGHGVVFAGNAALTRQAVAACVASGGAARVEVGELSQVGEVG